mmetsp:Transcript_15819/g.26997  ORF Transcript_15819/g.26997 Transcript_15819/m.26997 type:complete len:221 (+) Transcript_15819:72-734(+)
MQSNGANYNSKVLHTMTVQTAQTVDGFGTAPIAATHSSRSIAMTSSRIAAAAGGGSTSSTFRSKGNQRMAPDGRWYPTLDPRSRQKSKKIQRKYQLLQSQTILLLGTAALSFVLFLLFTLPIGALIGLTLMVTSLGASLLLAYAAARTRYLLELEHPLGLIRYLPENLRAHLTEKSLHECLSPSGSMESLSTLSHHNYSSKDSLSSMSMQNSSSKGSLHH